MGKRPDKRLSAGTAGAAARPFGRSVLAGAMLITVTVGVYLPVMRAEYIWDDANYIREDPYLPTARAIAADDGLRRIWLTGETADYWPLTHTMFWAERRIWGTDPTGYHVVNVLLHALSGVLLWRLLKLLDLPGAWLGGLIFAVHPVCVASVGWISERKNTLSMVFYLLAILAYLQSERVGKWRWYAGGLGAFAGALLSKTSVVMLPVVLVMLAWWDRGKVTKKDLLRIAPFFAMSLVMGVVTIWFQQHRAIGGEVVRTEGFPARLGGAGWAVWFYLYKAVLPVHLSMIYRRWTVDAGAVVSWIPLGALVAMLWVLWRFRRSWGRGMLLAMGYFIATLFPVLGFFEMYFMRFSLVADHFQYVSIVGIIALAGGILWRVCVSRGRAVRWVGRGAVSVGIAALCVLTWEGGGVYRNRRTLWEDTVAKNPTAWVAHYNLGLVYADSGQLEKAVERYETAVALRPDYAQAHNNLAATYMLTGRFEKATEHYRAAVKLIPKHPNPHFSLGNICAKKGALDEAIGHYRTALKLDPNHVEGHFNLGVVYGKRGRAGEAGEHYRAAIRLEPNHPQAHNNLGLLHAKKGELDLAVEHYLTAIAAKPDYALAHRNLGRTYQQKGDLEKAAQHYRTAIRIRPDYAEARENLRNLTGN